MKIKLNGKFQELENANVSIIELLKLSNVKQPEMVSVQLNGEFVLAENYAKTVLKENDEFDFLYFMGGGQQLTIYNL